MRTFITLALLGAIQFLFAQTDSLYLELGPPEQFYCPGSSLDLTAETNGMIISWSTGETGNMIMVSTPGLYSVTVTDGEVTMADSVIVAEVTDSLEVSIDGPFETCNGIPDTLQAVAAQASSYYWSNGETTPSVIIDSADIYMVTVTNACGDTATADWSVLNLPVPEVEIYASGTLECPNDQVILSIDSPFGIDVLWSNESSEIFTIVSDPGTYWVEAYNDCGTDYDTITVESLNKPFPELYLTSDKTLICEGETATLYANTNTEGFLVWSTGQVLFDSITVDSAGTYEAVFINECGRARVEISISGPPLLEVTIDAPADMCEGTPERLTALSTNAVSYEWSEGTLGPEMSTPTPGLYSVTVTGICGEQNTATHFLAGVPYPEVSIRQEAELLCESSEVTLIADALYADEYEWTTGATTPDIPIRDRGLYGVTVRNRCFDASDEILLPTVPVPAYVPNAFSPNGDEVNDVFYPILPCPEAGDYQFRIFSRWGQLVYESSTLNEGWDGLLRGSRAGEGVYVWVVDFRIRDRSYHLRGDVVLVR